MVAYVGGSGVTSGAGTSTASSLTVPFPAGAAAGNVARLVAESLRPTTNLAAGAPSGWNYPNAAPDVNGGNGVSWMFWKELTASDIAAGSVTITFDQAQQCIAEMDVWSGVTGTGVLTATNIDTASNTNEPVPLIDNVPAGAIFAVAFAYRSAASVPDVNLGAGYTQGGRTVAADTSPYLSIEGQFKTADVAGSYGGESATSAGAATGVAYSIAIPASGGTPPPPAAGLDVGATAATALYVGATAASKAYLGSTQVWP